MDATTFPQTTFPRMTLIANDITENLVEKDITTNIIKIDQPPQDPPALLIVVRLVVLYS